MANATFRPVEPLDAGRVLNWTCVIVGNLLSFVPLALALVGGGLCGWAFFMALPDGIMAERREWDEQVGLGVLFFGGLLLGAGCLYWTFRNMTSLGNYYLRCKARRLIKRRMEYAVDPDDPEAVFVEVVPRANWQRLMIETATDIGFLAIDLARSQVLFEGDREVYRLPRAAIITCSVEGTYLGGSEGGVRYFFTVLIVQTASGLREIPVAYRGDLGALGAEVREERAIGLRDRILAL